MTTYIYSYNPHSASAKALAEALGIKRIRRSNSHFVPHASRTIINWGSTSLPDDIFYGNSPVINPSDLVAKVTDKLKFFKMVDEELTVPWTTEHRVVRVWLDQGKTVVARQKLTGHSGEGIVILEGAGTEIIGAPLYTLYVPKKDEYRVHCYRNKDGDVMGFDVQRKARKLDVPNEEVDWRVRNLNGGFIYQRENIDVPDIVKDVALKVFEQTGLEFGAVDIIYQEAKNKAFALEINTAPGLSGTTLENYVQMFKELIEE